MGGGKQTRRGRQDQDGTEREKSPDQSGNSDRGAGEGVKNIEQLPTNKERLEKALLDFIESHTKETSDYTSLVPAMAEVLIKLWSTD